MLIFCMITLLSHLINANPWETLCGTPHNMRHTAFIIASLMLTGGGVYLLTQKTEKKLEKTGNLLGGFILISCGLGGILLGEEIVESIEHAIIELKQSAIK